jgi:small neutral amino acid transporter SnatA (MarC family)
MTALDLVVGAASIGLGILLCVTGAANLDYLQHHSKLRWLTAALGRTGARVVCSIVGLLLVALGVAIALGWRMQWS